MKKPKNPPKTAPSPFNATALQWFRGLHVDSQIFLLKTIAQFKAWQLGRDESLPLSVLLATPEQRHAARLLESRAQKRLEIRRQLQALHNRAQRKAPWHLTPQQQRRREALYAKLEALDAIGSAK